MSTEDDIGAWWAELEASTTDRDSAIHNAYQQLDNAGLVSKVVVHRYRCRRRGCELATVIRVGDAVIARTRDNKLSPGLNLDRTVPAARIKNTLDGRRHWPGHTFDVAKLAEWGPAAGMGMECHHVLGTVLAVDVLATVDGVRPGHPGEPTKL